MNNGDTGSCASPAFCAGSCPSADAADQVGKLPLAANLDSLSLVELAKRFRGERSQQLQLFAFLTFLLFQQSQSGAQDLARVAITSGLDLFSNKLIEVLREIDIACGHL
jgi:hypothetical protein